MNRITAKLADVATISFAGSRMTPGFGSIEQHAAEIEREDFRSIDFSTSVEFGIMLIRDNRLYRNTIPSIRISLWR